MSFKVEYIAEEWQLSPPPAPVYKTEIWGPTDRPWEITFVANNPYSENLRIKGKRYVDGEYAGDYIQWL